LISTDKAFDLLPYAVTIFDKLQLGKYIADTKKSLKEEPKTPLEAGLEVFQFVLKNSGKIKEEIFDIVAVVSEKPKEEIKKQSFAVTLNSFKEIFTDKELLNFFKSAM